ncbi:MAG TPA: HPr(Ser) kinase/phosphatase [Ignavibacteria bacterium]
MFEGLKNIKEFKKESITVEFFYKENKDRFKLTKISGKDINPATIISEKDIHRPGLALAGYVGLFTFNRIQLFGNTEINYLKQLDENSRISSLHRYTSFDIPCIIVTNDNDVDQILLDLADDHNIPVFKTPYPTTRFSYMISDFLDDQFSPQIALHSSFVDVYGVGLLFCGKSGIGKSEIALDLIERGHRLVADDIVLISKKAVSVLMGSGTALVKHFMEIRGLGIIDVRRIFGIRAIRFQKRVEVIVVLENWDKATELKTDRTGLNSTMTNLLGVDIETIFLQIFPGKNITVIAEIIALNYLSKHYGYNAAQEFEKRLEKQIEINKKLKSEKIEENKFDRTIEYFEHDFE